jgi:hypothetical protein
MREAQRRELAGTDLRPDERPADAWKTDIDRHHVAAFSLGEVHAVFFEPIDDRGGTSKCVAVQIPETPSDKIAGAMAFATRTKARVVFLCDTRDQADAVATLASAALTAHRRVPYERAEAGAWGLLA